MVDTAAAVRVEASYGVARPAVLTEQGVAEDLDTLQVEILGFEQTSTEKGRSIGMDSGCRITKRWIMGGAREVIAWFTGSTASHRVCASTKVTPTASRTSV